MAENGRWAKALQQDERDAWKARAESAEARAEKAEAERNELRQALDRADVVHRDALRSWANERARVSVLSTALHSLADAVKPICQWWTLERQLASEDHDALADAFKNAHEALAGASPTEGGPFSRPVCVNNRALYCVELCEIGYAGGCARGESAIYGAAGAPPTTETTPEDE